jgi:GDPmannose 4,6-dehydratase
MGKSKKALIKGITGQDGSYLVELLVSGVHGLVRCSSTFNTRRIDHLHVDPHEPGVKFFLPYGDLTDSGPRSHLIFNIQPHEICHLEAQSHVRPSFDLPEFTGDVTGLGGDPNPGSYLPQRPA